METTIVHCDDCGAYLGDLVGGVLYKFGQVVKEQHVCESERVFRSAEHCHKEPDLASQIENVN